MARHTHPPTPTPGATSLSVCDEAAESSQIRQDCYPTHPPHIPGSYKQPVNGPDSLAVMPILQKTYVPSTLDVEAGGS